MHVLFLCTGNTCRSPMAEAFFCRRVQGRCKASSAGFAAHTDDPASEGAKNAMLAYGIRLYDHRARRVTADMLHAADLVLTMTEAHAETARTLAPDARVFPLIDYAEHIREDIPDPYMRGQAAYDACATRISRAVDALICILNKGG